MKKTEYIKETTYNLCSVPDSEGLILEVSTKDEPALLEIRVDSSDVQWIRFFANENHVAMTLDSMQKAIDIAKKEVVTTSLD